MRVNDAFARICEVEQERDLLRHTVDGWSAWPILRVEAMAGLTAVSYSHYRKPGVRERALLAVRDLPRLTRVRHARHLVKTYSSGLIDESQARYSDIWFDDLIQEAGSTFKLEMVNNPEFSARSRQALIPKDLSGSALEIAAEIAARYVARPELNTVCRAFVDALRDGLGLQFVSDEWVSLRLRRFSALKRVYGALLRRVRPKFVLVADAGERALVAAAKENDCVALELQHGIVDSSHPGYSWTAYARPYRATMPLPDRLLVHGEHWRRELDADSFWGDALRVVGNPRIDKYRRTETVRSEGECTALFTTQGLEVKAVTEFLCAFLRATQDGPPLHLVIKLHPVFDGDKGPYLEALSAFRNRVDVLSGTEGATTFELLRRANMHMSISSASHYDAIALAVPTIILPFSTYETVLPLHRAGHAELARTPEDLRDLAIKWRGLRLGSDVSDYYCRPGALDNLMRELDLPAGRKRDSRSVSPH
jgi:hypothetical protein